MNFKEIVLISIFILVISLASVSASDLEHVAVSDSHSDDAILAHAPVTVSSHGDSVVIDNLDDVPVDDSSIDDGDKSIPADSDDSSIDDGDKPIPVNPQDDIDGDINDGDSIIINITNDTSKNKYNDKPISNVKEASGSFKDLKSIIDLTPSGTTLYLSRDYKGSEDNQITVNKNLTIDGQGHTLDGNRACRIFYSTQGNIVLKNLKLINGYVDGWNPDDYSYYGGAILIEVTAKYTIENCLFENNWADDYGGAIANLGNLILTVKNCTFKSNTADDEYGGAIYSRNYVLIEDSTFKDNTAYNGGGAISLSESNNYIDKIINCSFESNSAEARGGAIYAILNHNLTIEGSTFKSNYAYRSGGAISTEGNTVLNVANSFFEDNKVVGSIVDFPYGGAISNEGANSSIDNSIFNGNYADSKGGAIYSSSPVTISNSNFTSNSAYTTGGAVETSIDSSFYNCLFNSNSCDGGVSQNRGGAIHGEEKISIYDSIFNNNYAKTDGGAVYSDEVVLAKGCTFDSNRAFGSSVKCYGGAIRAAYVEITSCIFTKNYCENHGGAIFTDTTASLIKDCKFIENKADEDGGAVYINNENTVTFKQCSFINNRAGDEGGAIYLDSKSAHITLNNNLFSSNIANNGKAVYNYGFYDGVSSNWWGSETPSSSNHMLVEWHFISDDYHTDSNPLTLAIVSLGRVVKVGEVSKMMVLFLNSDGTEFSAGVMPIGDINITLPVGIKEVSTDYLDNGILLSYVAENAGSYDIGVGLFDQKQNIKIVVEDALSSIISKDNVNGSQIANAYPIDNGVFSVVPGLKSVVHPQFDGNFDIMAAFLSLLSVVGL